jgi:HEAT repeat protein
MIKRYLTELSKLSKPIAISTLAYLSELSTEELKLFNKVWEKVEVKRRREVVHRLCLLTISNAKLNFDPLFWICLQDPDPEVRVEAIKGLWECEDCTLITRLIEKLTQDSEEIVRATAAAALGKFALLAELQKISPRYIAKIRDVLFSIINDQEERPKVRCCAIEAAASLNLPKVKEIIYQTYMSQEIRLKISALRAMGRNCDPRWLPMLVKELSSPIPELRVEAARACGELGEEEVEPYLIKLTKDAEDQVRLTAIEALAKVGGSEAEGALGQCLGDANEQIRHRAKEAIQKVRFRGYLHF